MNKEAFVEGFLKIAKNDKEIKAILAGAAGLSKSRPIKNTDYLQKHLGLDDLDRVEICMALEDKFKKDMPAAPFDEFMKKDRTVQELIDHWHKHSIKQKDTDNSTATRTITIFNKATPFKQPALKGAPPEPPIKTVLPTG